MVFHKELVGSAYAKSKAIYLAIRAGKIEYAGNNRLKIYGRLDCLSGKRMRVENRVFFMNEKEALAFQFRPCGNCLPKKYRDWKSGIRNYTGNAEDE